MNRMLQALQILKLLAKRHKAVKKAILDELGLTDDDFEDVVEDCLREEVLDDLEECGCCGGYHRPEFSGDCRDDNERF